MKRALDDDDDAEQQQQQQQPSMYQRARKETHSGRTCPYLDTVNRYLLDFDFEKVRSRKPAATPTRRSAPCLPVLPCPDPCPSLLPTYSGMQCYIDQFKCVRMPRMRKVLQRQGANNCCVHPQCSVQSSPFCQFEHESLLLPPRRLRGR